MQREERKQEGHIHLIGIVILILVGVAVWVGAKYYEQDRAIAMHVKTLEGRVGILEARVALLERNKQATPPSQDIVTQ